MNSKQYEDMITNNTPEGYPQLVCGWPDEEHGITWDNYISDAVLWVENTEEGDDAPQYMSFAAWKDTERDDNPDRDNLGFSNLTCDLCGDLPGDRHAVTALPDDPATNHDYVALAVCSDCLMYIANSDLPEWLEEEA